MGGDFLYAAPVLSRSDFASEEIVPLSGTVWLDENVDGIRQPSEPALAGAAVDSSYGAYPGFRVTADEQGQYTHRPSYVGEQLDLEVRVELAESGSSPEIKSTGSWDSYTHYGCADIYIATGDTERTVDIRVTRRESASPTDWPLVDGRFFRRARCDGGFSVTNAGGIPFWDAWQSLGLENVGYPISHRFKWKGFVTQAFEKLVFQWQPGKGVYFVNVLDEMHAVGADRWLGNYQEIPTQLGPAYDAGKSLDEIVRDRLALLDANKAIKEAYFGVPEPLLQYGLPTSRIEDYGNVVAIRTQRAVFQQWKEAVPWARAGELTRTHGGELAKERCLFPADAMVPQPPGYAGLGPGRISSGDPEPC